MCIRDSEAQRNVVFTYRLVPGIAESSYGTQVAALAGVPDAVCERAARVSQEFFDAAAEQQQRRAHSRVPLESLCDFARLVGIARGARATADQLALIAEHAAASVGATE